MTDNKYDRRLPKRLKGRLDQHNLWRATAGAKNVFTRKQERKNKEYHVLLLIDQSGSMMGTRIELAAETAMFVAKSLDKSGVRLTIRGFNRYYARIKDEGEKLDLDKIREKVMHPFTERYGLSDNNDHEALKAAYAELENARHGKLLMVFSDGSPDNNYSGKTGDAGPFPWVTNLSGGSNELENIRNTVMQSGIDTVGIGIQSETVRHIYPNHEVVNDLDEFKPRVLKALRRAIKRG